MSLISKILHQAAPGYLSFWCPGCDGPHTIKHDGPPGPNWGWNGSCDRPTFSPSVLATWNEPSPVPGEHRDRSKDVEKRCHSFVTDGQIQFLTDCTHELAGKTVPLAEFPNAWGVARQEVAP